MPPQRRAPAFYSLWIAILLPLAACDAGDACEASIEDEEEFALCMNADERDEWAPDGDEPLPDDPDSADDDIRCKPSDIAVPGMKFDPGSLPISCGPPLHPAKP